MTVLPPELPPPLPTAAARPPSDHGTAIPMPMAIPVKLRRRSSMLPVIAWASLATLAVAYMGLVSVRPDLVARAIPPAGDRRAVDVATSAEAHSQYGEAQDVEALRSKVRLLESEIATLRSKLATADMPGDANPLAGIAAQDAGPGSIVTGSTRPATPETPAAGSAGDDGPELPVGPNLRLTPAPVAKAPSTSTTPTTDLTAVSPAEGIRIINGGTAAAVAQAAPTSATTTPKAEPEAKVAAKSGTPGKTDAATKPARIETGSVEPPVKATEIPAFGEAVVKPEPKPLGLAIGSGPTVDTLRLNWSLISESNAEQLAKLEPRYKTSVDGNGLVYNLFAGPIKSKAQGRELCKALAKRAIPCAVVDDFGGEGL